LKPVEVWPFVLSVFEFDFQKWGKNEKNLVFVCEKPTFKTHDLGNFFVVADKLMQIILYS